MGIFYNPTLSYNQQNPPASGGTVTEITKNGIVYRVHTFTNVGVSTLTVNRQLNRVEYLVVAGGGAGGNAVNSSNHGGGGGAGGLLLNTKTLAPANSYTVIVGAGGALGNTSPGGVGGNGNPSSFDGTSALGGGGGGNAAGSGANGGSGGGGGSSISDPGNGGSGEPGQGNSGAAGAISPRAGGGGGGYTSSASGTTGGSGYIATDWLAGSNLPFTTLAAGGKGGSSGGLRVPVTANTGFGGDGGISTSFTGLVGASGIVIVRYPIGVVGQ